MLLGALVYALMLNLLLTPPVNISKYYVNVWFCMNYLVFTFTNIFLNVPYYALGPELVDNYDDRNRLYYVLTMFELAGLFCAVFLPGFITKNYKLRTDPCPYGKCLTDKGIGKSCLAEPLIGIIIIIVSSSIDVVVITIIIITVTRKF